MSLVFVAQFQRAGQVLGGAVGPGAWASRHGQSDDRAQALRDGHAGHFARKIADVAKCRHTRLQHVGDADRGPVRREYRRGAHTGHGSDARVGIDQSRHQQVAWPLERDSWRVTLGGRIGRRDLDNTTVLHDQRVLLQKLALGGHGQYPARRDVQVAGHSRHGGEYIG